MVGDVNNDLEKKDGEQSCSAKEVHRNWCVQTDNSVQLVINLSSTKKERKKERKNGYGLELDIEFVYREAKFCYLKGSRGHPLVLLVKVSRCESKAFGIEEEKVMGSGLFSIRRRLRTLSSYC